MKVSTFHGYDYRTGKSSKLFTEVNFVGSRWNLRVLLPTLGLSLWHNYKQVARLNYPAT